MRSELMTERLLSLARAGDEPAFRELSEPFRRELGWTLRYPSWRQGFAELYVRSTDATSAPRSVPATAEGIGSSSR
jgi:hypothetical protein